MNLTELQVKCEIQVFKAFASVLEKNPTKDNFTKLYLINHGFCKVSGFVENARVLDEYKAFKAKGYDDDDLYFDCDGLCIYLKNSILKTSSYLGGLSLSFTRLDNLTKSEFLAYSSALEKFESSLWLLDYEKQKQVIVRLRARIEELEANVERLQEIVDDSE